MAYVSTNYKNNTAAPVGKWTCAPTSSLDLYSVVPPEDKTKKPDYCGQCVSYVKKVCPTLPATAKWKKGPSVKDNKDIMAGTVIATFKGPDYFGHAAIYVSQDKDGMNVYDQYVSPPSPKAVGPRTLKFGAPKDVNNGDKYYVVVD